MSLRGFFTDLLLGGACRVVTGTGSPESAVTAGVGSVFLRTDGAVGSILYVKHSGSGNTGWGVLAGSVLTATVTLTDAQVKALPTTPVTIIAAPGSGYRIKPIGATLKVAKTAAYTNINATYAALYLTYPSVAVFSSVTDDSTTTPALTRLTSFLTGTGTTITDILPTYVESFGTGAGYVVTNSTAVANVENVVVQLAADNNGSGNFTGGNAANSLKATITYLVEPI